MKQEIEILINAIWKHRELVLDKEKQAMQKVVNRLRCYSDEEQNIDDRRIIDDNLDAYDTYKLMTKNKRVSDDEAYHIVKEVYKI